MKNRSNKQSGQTILEVIIAMAIITITITGVASLTLNIVNYGYDSEARSLAVNIAQETLDTIKNVRDNDTCGFFSKDGGYYRLDVPTNQTTNWRLTYTGVADEPLDPTEFNNDPTVQNVTNMTRTIEIDNIADAISGGSTVATENGRRITVTIGWEIKGDPASPNPAARRTYVTATDIYKWQ